ncbi:ScbR family autoregulator-binding transcription factor [Kitasatospora sp. GP82]|uniref:ScbR family autoregulator-binding transcription factor n=1 Tax=Kitasatospora sp. GP82 TaxID=3035089 RepID=UPI002475A588|nr:ScbR family autoregulator-binding transcription factor [Kitasatospora sp. GP82]MDH6123563.1 AcrR family transcriptional regulator [Kitasatospora sp. GP82]
MRQERAERTRQLLVEAAAASFDTAGYTMTGLGDVTKLSGMSKGALYFHFGSKEQLAEAVLAASREGLREIVGEARRSGDSTVQYLIDLCHALARRVDEDVVFRAGLRLTGDPGLDRAICPSPQGSWVKMVRLLLNRAAGRHQVRVDVPVEVTATLLAAAMTGVEVLARQDRQWLGREVVTRLWQAVLPTLVPPEELRRLHPAGPKTEPEAIPTDAPDAPGAEPESLFPGLPAKGRRYEPTALFLEPDGAGPSF